MTFWQIRFSKLPEIYRHRSCTGNDESRKKKFTKVYLVNALRTLAAAHYNDLEQADKVIYEAKAAEGAGLFLAADPVADANVPPPRTRAQRQEDRQQRARVASRRRAASMDSGRRPPLPALPQLALPAFVPGPAMAVGSMAVGPIAGGTIAAAGSIAPGPIAPAPVVTGPGRLNNSLTLVAALFQKYNAYLRFHNDKFLANLKLESARNLLVLTRGFGGV